MYKEDAVRRAISRGRGGLLLLSRMLHFNTGRRCPTHLYDGKGVVVVARGEKLDAAVVCLYH